MIYNLSTPTVIGLLVTLLSFGVFIYGLVYREFTWQGYQIFWLSLILGPIAMVSSMIGYSAWWLSKFISTLLSRGNDAGSLENDRDSNK